MERPRSVNIVGTGNVATHLARAFAAAGVKVESIWSRNISHARVLAGTIPGARPIDNLGEISVDADVTVIAVPDSAISAVVGALPPLRGVLAHTSGTVPIDVLPAQVAGEGTGVFYPLQTFSRDKELDVSQVPFFIEATAPYALSSLKSLASLISGHVYEADSSKRATLHLAAVFACNFSNALWDIAADVLVRDGYPLHVFSPLLHETLDKALLIGPHAAQTGPAVRHDTNVISSQLSRLSGLPHDIYDIITRQIIQSHEQDKL